MKGHVGKYKEEPGLIDLWVCSCGWESNPYYDGAHWAEAEFKRHLEAVKAKKEKA
jgi:CDGSH-type Zn-finger protein